MNIEEYLNRIGYDGPRDASYEALRRLHRSHLLSVPFENLDIHLGRPIRLQYESLFQKVVRHRRGGFCYELNGLFGLLLQNLGFKVRMLSAGVARPNGGFGPEFDHMTLMVELPEPWLADVGFGDSFLEPVAFGDSISVDASGTYRLARENELFYLQRSPEPGRWEAQYRFTLAPRDLSDYEEMCIYHQTSPQSTFTQRRLCTRATAGGRFTLSDMLLIERSNSERSERKLLDQHDYDEALREHFGVELH